jgi:hypothetical protein
MLGDYSEVKISELVAALSAELIRGNDAEIGFTVPVEIELLRNAYLDVHVWRFNGMGIQSMDKGLSGGPSLQFNHQPNSAEFRHRDDGVMEIVLT